MSLPTLRTERALLRDEPGAVLAAIDEVGRGALAGPVAVGVVLVDDGVPPAPRGVRDSKACPRPTREALAPRIRQWARASAVGLASAEEIDAVGIVRALGVAAVRALNGLACRPDIVLLDGSHDWIGGLVGGCRVVTRVKADSTCAAVAAASIIAKVARDQRMLELVEDYPDYGWADNKGYGSPDHLAALRHWGPTPHHRISWRLPAVTIAT